MAKSGRHAVGSRADGALEAALAERNAVLDNIDYGVILFDEHLRARVVNQVMLRLWHFPQEFIDQRPTMREMIEFNRNRGMYDVQPEEWDDWVEERVEHVRQGSFPPRELRRADGMILKYQCVALPDGGRMLTYFDITDLKQRAEELAEKTAALEALSSKLSKYLAPQIYDSIFSGRQDVKILSKRKKLTICFSDIADFTEITDKMESEDLTQLLNTYLTEMSRIALEYGATIDKYVGDAIMMFFGDPESRGVKEDALACVRMALAMQTRIGELAMEWHEIGIETPLLARMGIHTGYCTVGNFGSEDRMDYTIIGKAVNLASRLEQEAPSGGILISYETYAHVKYAVTCEEKGQVRVRGMAYPLAVFAVTGLNAPSAQSPTAAEIEWAAKVASDPESYSAAERREAASWLAAAAGSIGT